MKILYAIYILCFVNDIVFNVNWIFIVLHFVGYTHLKLLDCYLFIQFLWSLWVNKKYTQLIQREIKIISIFYFYFKQLKLHYIFIKIKTDPKLYCVLQFFYFSNFEANLKYKQIWDKYGLWDSINKLIQSEYHDYL